MAFNSPPLYPFYQASYQRLNSYLADDRKRKGAGRRASEVGNKRCNNRGDASPSPLWSFTLFSRGKFDCAVCCACAGVDRLPLHVCLRARGHISRCIRLHLRVCGDYVWSTLWVSRRRSLTIAYLFRAFWNNRVDTSVRWWEEEC